MIAHVILGILLFFEGLSKKGMNEAKGECKQSEMLTLESCRRKVLYVDEVTQDSAVLYWRSERAGESKVCDLFLRT